MAENSDECHELESLRDHVIAAIVLKLKDFQGHRPSRTLQT